ncbi:MAG: BatA and WFA domain-containing protein, partial [Planctomycetales bacterium]
MLSIWQWAILGLVPPAILALYFLKLKRLPLEVPSTYLWRKSIEDLHVNSLWQKLRRSLLLWLQLLLMALVILALWNPSWEGSKFSGNRFIFIIDNSASMNSADGQIPVEEGEEVVAVSRLTEAKRRIAGIIDAMKAGDIGMLISFSDRAQVVQEYTTNRAELMRKLEAVEPSNHSTSIAGALRLAAALANPGRSGNPEDAGDAAAPEALRAQLFVLSDFKFPDVPDFSLGNLYPEFIMVGDRSVGNIGIVHFNARRHETQLDKIQVFARLENNFDEEKSVAAALWLDDEKIDIHQVTIPANDFQQVPFQPMDGIESGVLKLTLEDPVKDAPFDDPLQIDNTAWAVVNVPHRSQVLFVSSSNIGMERILNTRRVQEMANITFAKPVELKTKQYLQKAAMGFYDLIIYDNCSPPEMPRANTFFIGQIPPSESWTKGDTIIEPQIIDTEATHPLMQLVQLGDVGIAESFKVDPPPGGIGLIESHAGPIFAIGPRDGYEDAVMGFTFESSDEEGHYFNTNWPLKQSFPVFIQDLITYLRYVRSTFSDATVRPGRPYLLYRTIGPELLNVEKPDDQVVEVRRGENKQYNFVDTEQVGVYTVDEKIVNKERFAINLFDSME